MPIWPVTFTDGMFQVADADGQNYPLTMVKVGVTEFNAGWSPRGLQTGLPPLHVLELEHEGHGSAIWFVDQMLDYRGNGVSHLHDADRQAFFAAIEPMVREIFDQAVLPRIAAVPAAARNFDGFLPASVAELLREATALAVPRPDAVSGDAVRAGGSFGRGEVQLPAAWVEAAMRADVPAAGAEVLDLGAHRALRRFDERLGVVSYLLQGGDASDRHLYVPAAGLVFTDRADHDPVAPLVLWYATHTDRAVPLPEIDDLGLDLIRPDAPSPHDEARHDPAPHDRPRHDPDAFPSSQAAETFAEPQRSYAFADAEPEPLPDRVVADAPAPHPYAAPAATADASSDGAVPERPRADAAKQNWWQRLLGLGDS